MDPNRKTTVANRELGQRLRVVTFTKHFFKIIIILSLTIIAVGMEYLNDKSKDMFNIISHIISFYMKNCILNI